MEISTSIIGSIVLAVIFTVFMSGCGIALGDKITVGTTGFLQEHNRGKEIALDYYTPQEKLELSKLLGKNK